MNPDEEKFVAECEVAEERAADRFWADAQLGARVRELLASEEPHRNLVGALGGLKGNYTTSRAAWAWFREQLLAGNSNAAMGSLATGGAMGGQEQLQEALRRQAEAEEDAHGR